MSDFIFSRKRVEQGLLSEKIQSIYSNNPPNVKEFHGDWGSFAVSDNLYQGFSPFENNEYIFTVIGGPVLCFDKGNSFFIENEGTTKLFEYWKKKSHNINWDEELSGPFVLVIINKADSSITCITDLLSFIPVYIYKNDENIALSTHVDVLALIADEQKNIDVVSQLDFILNGVITYPYTTYKYIKQVAPASTHIITLDLKLESKFYWLPREINPFESIKEAAEYLQRGLENYINKTSSTHRKIAHFISGGEDSRVLSALLPKGVDKDAFIFLDEMNREGDIAKKAAEAFGSKFFFAKRRKMHYLEILEPCVNLVGSGSQYVHVHSYGFHKGLSLMEYPAVYGGLFSDALLKGIRIRKIRGSDRYPFIPDIKNKKYSPVNKIENKMIKKSLLQELNKRRANHFLEIKKIRRDSAEEWFELWPSSMNMNIPNLHGNRRLFASYEPFMAKEVVKTSASIPQHWKLNRRLFNLATRHYLKPIKWLSHGDGRLPYFSFRVNIIIQFLVWCYREGLKKVGFQKGNQGPWSEWKRVLEDPSWNETLLSYSLNSHGLNNIFNNGTDILSFYNNGNLNNYQKINIMQLLYLEHVYKNQ